MLKIQDTSLTLLSEQPISLMFHITIVLNSLKSMHATVLHCFSSLLATALHLNILKTSFLP